MKKSILFILSIIFSFSSFGQDSSKVWDKGGLASINFNQISFTNWAAGGESSFSGTALFNGYLNYKKGKSIWDNSLGLGYGLMKLGDSRLQKSEDRIILNSKYGRQIVPDWYYSTLLNFQTQFASGYNYPNDTLVVSRFLAPAFLIVSIGLDYKPVPYFSIYISPATGKFTFVNDQKLADEGMFGVTAAEFTTSGDLIRSGKKSRAEFGAYLSAKFEKNVMENVSVKSILNLFNNYTDVKKENRGNIDVNWETNINLKVNKYISATLFTHLIYDHDIFVPLYEQVNDVRTVTGKGRRVQFKEVFGVGFGYKF